MLTIGSVICGIINLHLKLMTNSRINFILPFKPRRPAGGFRVMYEYANRFAQKGYKVHLTFPIHTPYMNYRLPYYVRKLITLIEKFDKDKWFVFDPTITMSYVPKVDDKYIIDSDIIITTWWSTVLESSKLSKDKGGVINLIQGFENWEGHENLLYESYNLPNVVNIVVANYLEKIVNQHTDKETIVIPNAISEDKFFLYNPIEDRNPYHVIMTYSEQEIKGSVYGIRALEIVKAKFPQLTVTLFGVCVAPSNLPEWISFFRNPSNLCELYNQNSIILSNSFTEGFPLTPAEGMLCGCALICTDIEGHREYAIEHETAILVPIKQPEVMANAILKLLENNSMRISLAQRGQKYIRKYSWDNSFRAMKNVVDGLINKNTSH